MTPDQLFLIGLVLGQALNAVTHVVVAKRKKAAR